jgi:hypothetical protein
MTIAKASQCKVHEEKEKHMQETATMVRKRGMRVPLLVVATLTVVATVSSCTIVDGSGGTYGANLSDEYVTVWQGFSLLLSAIGTQQCGSNGGCMEVWVLQTVTSAPDPFDGAVENKPQDMANWFNWEAGIPGLSVNIAGIDPCQQAGKNLYYGGPDAYWWNVTGPHTSDPGDDACRFN